MDWKVFSATFLTIFLAELGDKTQLANLCLSAKSGSPFSILTASVLAFTVVTVITVALGGLGARFIRPEYVRYGAASLFLLVSILMFAGKL